MGREQSRLRSMGKSVFGSVGLPAWAALMVIILTAIFAIRITDTLHEERMRVEMLHKANLVASRLQGLVTANIEVVRGMAALIATQPDMTQEQFATLSANLLHDHNQLNNLAAARGLVVSMVYPVKGNESVFGFDIRQNEEQRTVAFKVRDTEKMAVAGPVNLVQGGQGFIARFPVFFYTDTGERVFWGLLASVINIDKLYKAAGLNDDPDVHYALRGKDATGPDGEHFFGPADIAQRQPVESVINVASGSWILSAVPVNGWQNPGSDWMVWGAALIAIGLVVVPYAWMGWLSRERVAHLRNHLRGQARLSRMAKRLELAIKVAEIGVFEHDLATGKTRWDDKMFELHGIDPSIDVNTIDWRSYVHPDDLERVNMALAHAIETETDIWGEFRICRADGSVRSVRTSSSIQKDALGRKCLIGVNWDITEEVERTRQLVEARAESDRRNDELEKANARIEINSLHDFLTGLPNRRYLDDKLKGLDQKAIMEDEDVCLLKIDLDGFKEVNDSLGHAAGDNLLIHVATLLQQALEEDEFVARIGGDEFVILCRTDKDQRHPTMLAETIIKAIKRPIHFRGRPCKVGASVGIAHINTAQGDPDKLLSNADLALYEAKQNGKGRYSYFSQPLFDAASKQRRLVDEILNGIENGEFIAFFQGQYCTHTHDLCGAEALVRWNHPERGILPPVEFLDVAEGLGVVEDIDAIVLEQALAERKRWNRAGLALDRISVNVSARRLGRKDLIRQLRKLNFEPGSLTFELVESTFLDTSDEIVAWNIDQFREMGIDIELDDFGTAYASIVSLTNLRPNRLKIDRQLVEPTRYSAEARELIRSIIHIGHAMNIGSVAEGIETMQHGEIMRDLGVDLLQGYAFSRPMHSEDFLKLHLARKEGQAA